MRHSAVRLSSPPPAHRLVVLLTLFFALGLVYALATPLFENPDESSHLQVIRYFAVERRLYAPATVYPPRSGADVATTLRPHTPPLYYTPPLYHALAALLVRGIHMDDLDSRLIPNPAWDSGWAPQRNADPRNKNMFIHLPGETWATSPTFRATLLLRLLSLSFSLVTILSAYHIARLIHPDSPAFALGTAACVALNPQFIALSAGVTNDPLLIAIVSLATLWMLRLMGTAARWPHWAVLGALVGLGLLTKQNALLLLPLGGLAIIGQMLNDLSPGWPATPHQQIEQISCMPIVKNLLHPLNLLTKRVANVSARKILTDALAFGGTAVLVGGGWYVYNALHYGDLLGTRTHFESQIPLRSFGWQEIIAIFETYWGSLGWALLSLPRWAYGLIAGMMALAVIGIARPLWHKHARRLAPLARRRLGLLAVLLLMNGAALVQWAIATGAPYGRLLLPSSIAIGVLLAWGLRQWHNAGLHLSAAFLAALATWTPWLLLAPAFGSPHSTAGIPPTAAPLHVTFDGALTMVAHETPERELRPGDTLPITLYWQAERALSQPYSAWVQFSPLDATRRVAEDGGWLGGTLYPSNYWRAGDVIRQSYTLRLPGDTPAPALYWVRIGVVNATGARVANTTGADMISLGPWRVRPQHTPSTPTQQVNAGLGEHITLRGYDVALSDTLVVTFTWAATGVPTQDYHVFVHLVDADGTLLAQHDGPPDGGRYPTQWWRRGDVIVDAHILPLAAPLPETAYLRVGMYDPITYTRLPAYDSHSTRLPDDIISLAIGR